MAANLRAQQRVAAKIRARSNKPTSTSSSNPYVDEDLATAQRQYCPKKNLQYEQYYNVKKASDNDKNYKHVWSDSDSSEAEEITPAPSDSGDRLLRGNEANTEMLVAKYVRDHESELALDIPECIGTLCFAFSYEPTNVVFAEWDDRIAHYVTASNGGKMVNINSRTVFIFSDDGYSSGHHVWHVKCHRVYNCQALGITEHKNTKYRYGDNIFDVSLTQQLGTLFDYCAIPKMYTNCS